MRKSARLNCLPVLLKIDVSNYSCAFAAWPVICPYLDETDILGLLTEALTADHQTVLSDDTSLVGASATAKNISVSITSQYPAVRMSLCRFLAMCMGARSVPLTAALAVGSWAAVEDGFVSHLERCVGDSVKSKSA